MALWRRAEHTVRDLSFGIRRVLDSEELEILFEILETHHLPLFTTSNKKNKNVDISTHSISIYEAYNLSGRFFSSPPFNVFMFVNMYQ